MRKFGTPVPAGLLTLAALAVLAGLARPAVADQATPSVNYAEQNWTKQDRKTFYTTSQGSQMMPLAWFKALRRLDIDAPFAGDQLQRYGYLADDDPGNTTGLPVGFVVDRHEPTMLGMTCAACHTGQLEYQQKDGTTYVLRLDGAPASADFQQFLADLRDASKATLNQPERFDAFAKAVLGAGYTAEKAGALRTRFAAWVAQFDEFMALSLPDVPWGPGRLDAFGMIFNRVAARDLGEKGNFAKADAPVSYPFLWNASRQDHTQWPGTVPNGFYVQALARNTGEVFGVFAHFAPDRLLVGPVHFGDNSADFSGLQTLEEEIVKLAPPPWPRAIFGLNEDLVARGKGLFEKTCGDCHGERPSPASARLWQTPVRAVHTDPKMLTNAVRKGDSGLYLGLPLPLPKAGLFLRQSSITDILAFSVVGSMLDAAIVAPDQLAQSGVWRAIHQDFAELVPDGDFEAFHKANFARVKRVKALLLDRLANLYSKPSSAEAGAAYESRVLRGIWATAPYLHNGSVPNLWELLKPAKERVTSFKVGSRVFDPENVGFATDQSPFKSGTFTADPANANGNGNQGHEYGTGLSEEDRWAIIEYLKQL